jgi:hypothetical protein
MIIPPIAEQTILMRVSTLDDVNIAPFAFQNQSLGWELTHAET